MHIRLRKLASMITAAVSLPALMPSCPAFAATQYQNTVLLGESFSLPETILDKAITWDTDTTTVDTSYR